MTSCHLPIIQGCRNVDQFEKLNKIDEGTYGVVYRARNKETGQVVALKQMKLQREKEGFPTMPLREISLLLQLDHPNIVGVQEIVVGSSHQHIFMVMEYMEHELKTLLEDMKNPFSPPELKCLMLQLLSAVDHMHQGWILHRDLKTSNLLFNNRGVLKVCDFGLARKYGDPKRPYTHNVVTLWYRPPELLLGQKVYTNAVDNWSAGCIMGEMVLRRCLFPGKGEHDQIGKIFSVTGVPDEKSWPGFEELPNTKLFKFNPTEPTWRDVFPAKTATRARASDTTLTDLGLELLTGLLTCCPEKRLTARQALRHPYFDEPPRPQRQELMPTWPESNAKTHDSRKRVRSLDERQIAERAELFNGEERFSLGMRVNPQPFGPLDKEEVRVVAKRRIEAPMRQMKPSIKSAIFGKRR